MRPQQKAVKAFLLNEDDDVAHSGRIRLTDGIELLFVKRCDVIGIQLAIVRSELAIAEKARVQEPRGRSAHRMNCEELAQDTGNSDSAEKNPGPRTVSVEERHHRGESRLLEKNEPD